MRVSKWILLGALTMVLAACSGNVGGGNGNPDGGGGGGGGGGGAGCTGPNPPAMCGATCENASQCGAGTYCGSEGTCSADCTPTGDECDAGQICGADGRCRVDPSTRPDAAPIDCPSVAVTTQPIIPTVQLLIDHSGSMDEGFGGTRRVFAVREALLDPDDGVVALLDDQVQFGAMLYTSHNGFDNGGTCPELPANVAPALNNYQAINDALRPLLTRETLGEDTPTGASIVAAADAFPAPGPNDKQIIVLATDGEPDTCTDPDPDVLDESRAESEAAAKAAHDDKNIDLFVLSVGSDVADAHLQRVANVGVGKAIDETADPATFYVANSPDELVAAFGDIIRGARECKFTVDNGRVTDASEGTVELNGEELAYPDEWDMLDETTLEIKGDACQTYLNAEVAQITAEFPCDAVIIVE